MNIVARCSVDNAGQVGCPFAPGRPVRANVLQNSLMLRPVCTLSGRESANVTPPFGDGLDWPAPLGGTLLNL